MSLPEAAAKGAAVEAMFDRIAGSYDRMNRVMTLGLDRSWRRRTVASLALRPGDRVLDLACGTGDLSADVARAGGRPVGLDVSANMLRMAARRKAAPGLVRAGAEGLPFAPSSFDAVVSGFALRNFSDLAAALDEAARVLRPGGRMALLEVDTPSRALLRAGHQVWFRSVVPLLGRLLADRDAYRYLPDSVVYLPAESELRAMLARAGIGAVAKRSFLGGAIQLVTGERAGGAHV